MKNKIILLPVIFILFVTWIFYQNRLSDIRNLAYQLNGVVEYVTYDEKGIPSIIVNKAEFYLDGGWDFNHLIEKGDTLKKTKGNIKVILIKQKNKTYTFIP